MKNRIALAALASVIAAPAFAADLGGNCCADLEERIAELEATTARKGNRRVSLTVSGHINEAIFAWWSDPVTTAAGQVSDDSGLYVATNNHSRSRFRFTGSANIDAEWSAGFLLEVGVRQTNNSQGGNFNQFDANEKSGLDVRHEALYIDSKRLGRVWIGHTGSATEGITEICVGCGVANYMDSGGSLGGFSTQANAPFPLNAISNWMNLASSTASQFSSGEGDRRDILMYVSPALMGFTVSAAVGSDKFYDVALRYAGEFNGIRIAAGIGYQKSEEQGGFAGAPVPGLGATALAGSTAAKGFAAGCVQSTTDRRVDCEGLGLAASAMHVPTGLYIHGSYGKTTDNNNNLVHNVLGQPTGSDDKAWFITGGINRKFHALGATNIWGEYGKAERNIGLPAIVPVIAAGALVPTSTEVKWFGVGIQQTIDAAALDVYLYYKHYEGDMTFGPIGSASVNDLDMVVLGAMIKF